MSRLVVLLAFTTASAFAQSVTGLWDATVTVNNLVIPFRMELSSNWDKAIGSFFNGDEKVTSTDGSFDGKEIRLRFAHYATSLTLSLGNDRLTGVYDRGPKGKYAVEARHFAPSPVNSDAVPSIAGLWEIGGVHSAKGEDAWLLTIRQAGPEATAAVLRIDGDTGTLSGTFRPEEGKFTLSHFSGARPSLFDLHPEKDGTLTVVQYGGKDGPARFTAVRSSLARAQKLPAPSDPSRHTTVKDPSEPFRFSGPDLNGNMVSSTDPQFRNKVVIVAVGGSWCPNCHDEAPFLQELYRKYHAAGLEIVSLSFEEAEQLKDLSRVRAFVKQYGIEYTVLVPGEPDELHAKLPQAVNLNSWPTSFFLGRDGAVKSVHAGFAGKASGNLHTEMRNEIESTVQKLLADDLRSAR